LQHEFKELQRNFNHRHPSPPAIKQNVFLLGGRVVVAWEGTSKSSIVPKCTTHHRTNADGTAMLDLRNTCLAAPAAKGNQRI
jgi:hypothetical protein